MLAVSIVTSTLTTQIKRQENIKLEAEKEKTRSNLLRAVSHDLRTPLTSILGASSAIIENDSVIKSAERLKLLNEVREESEWLIRMVENLLAITRIDNDGDSGTKIAKDLEAAEEIIADSAAKFKKRFPSFAISLKAPQQLLMVPMDAVLIEQVIINLLENVVIHAKGADRAELSVTQDGNFAMFSVSDNGRGIPQHTLPHIFDGYFNKTYESESDTKHNMGIGLSVCNTIIRAHNGSMTAGNKKDGGAIFTFSLPLCDNC